MRVLAATTFLVVLLMACSGLPNQAKTDRQIAEEMVECMLENGDGLVISFMGGKDAAAEMAEQSSTREQLIAARDKECREENAE